MKPLLVVAIGGHALSPVSGDSTLAGERRAAALAAAQLAPLAQHYRLLLLHGNGPQVGRLLAADDDLGDLDIRVAQTQGELGYLLAAALGAVTGMPAAALLTRVQVDPTSSAEPEKPVGPLLTAAPAHAHVAVAGGFRRTVPSPQPQAVIEMTAIASLLEQGHVVAGGGGGVPVLADGTPVAGVIDKDRVAALLAIELGAEALLIGTDVDGVYRDFGTAAARHLPRLSPQQARALLAQGGLGVGSMQPKVESALRFVTATGRPASIGAMAELEAVQQGRAGTRVQVPS